MSVQIGQKAPNLKVSKWVQGMDTNLDKQNDSIVVVEVFQVNCPGCFAYGIPESIEIYNKYKSEGVSVLGMATAFEDFDKNTLENLQLLLETGETVGETKKMLNQYGETYFDGYFEYNSIEEAVAHSDKNRYSWGGGDAIMIDGKKYKAEWDYDKEDWNFVSLSDEDWDTLVEDRKSVQSEENIHEYVISDIENEEWELVVEAKNLLENEEFEDFVDDDIF